MITGIISAIVAALIGFIYWRGRQFERLKQQITDLKAQKRFLEIERDEWKRHGDKQTDTNLDTGTF